MLRTLLPALWTEDGRAGYQGALQGKQQHATGSSKPGDTALDSK